MRTTITVVMLLLCAVPVLRVAAEPTTESPPARYEAREHYRFNLGGPSGEYTDWERSELDTFGGLTTTITIDKAYGKPTDKWASIARIILSGPGQGKDRPRLSLIAIVDRKDNHVQVVIDRDKDNREGLDAKLSVGKAFTVGVLPNGPGKLLVSIDKSTYDIPCDFDIKAIGVLGSGVDVKFEPFNLLHRTP